MLISARDINPGKENLQRRLSQGGAGVEVPGSLAQKAAPQGRFSGGPLWESTLSGVGSGGECSSEWQGEGEGWEGFMEEVLLELSLER